MKYFKFFLILICIPLLVLAEECDTSKITITSMEQIEIEGNTKVISDPTFEDGSINLDLKMYEVGDSITYDLTIKNDSEDDYMIDEDTFKTDSDYIEYSLKTNDNTNIVKANSSKEVSLVVTYKKEVEDDKLTNNKFDASNSLKLSLNTSDKEKELDIITTDNIKESVDPQEVKNPITSVSSMMLISFVLLITVLILYVLIRRKNKYTKFVVFVFAMLLIPTVYAICKYDIEVESTIEIEKLPKLYDTIVDLSKEENTCVTKYEGEITGEVDKTVLAENVYLDACQDIRNVVFGNFCWEVVRTTETKGTRLVYNGVAKDGKCVRSAALRTSVVITSDSIVSLDYGDDYDNSNDSAFSYLFGSSFTYDLDNKTFTLIDTFKKNWSEETSNAIIGNYTCASKESTCSTLFRVIDYSNPYEGKAMVYTMDEVDNSIIGNSPFNLYGYSLTSAGYMYSKVYDNSIIETDKPYQIKYGTSFDYDESTNTYTLTGETIYVKGWSSNYTYDENDPNYTCWNSTGTCSSLLYLHTKTSSRAYFFSLTNGQGIIDFIEEALNSSDVNKIDSPIKELVDLWYENNLIDYTDKLENTVYCNSRYLGLEDGVHPFDSNGNLAFMEMNGDTLKCRRIVDQFSISNSRAKLKYPVALNSYNELDLVNERSYFWPPTSFWTLSPYLFSSALNVRAFTVNPSGVGSPYISIGVRPSISLKNEIKVFGGNGTREDPWIAK